MISFGKIVAIAIIGLLSISILKKWALVILGVIALYFIIRFVADLYWYGKDNGRW